MIKRLFEWYGKKTVIAVFAVVALILVIGLTAGDDSETTLPTSDNVKEVKVATPATLANLELVSLIGTVRPQSEVKITNEKSGKVTSVNTSLGQSVVAGQILLSLENSAERASLLQAEGAYEAALASAKSSDSGLREAESRLKASKQAMVSVNDSTFLTVTDSLYNTLDKFYSNPTSGLIGLRINGKSQTEFLNNERLAFRDIIATWPKNVSADTESSVLVSNLKTAKTHSQRLVSLIDAFVLQLQDKDNSTDSLVTSMSALKAELSLVRSKVVGTISSIDNAVAGSDSAEEALKRAEISATGGEVSISEAQVKQALGMLRSAQSNYAKTILRSPISGTVNVFDVKIGAYLNTFSDVAVIANNKALELVVFVSDKEKARLAVGDTLTLDSGKATGTIISIAPAIDANTKKTEVRISVIGESLSSGQTVRVEKNSVQEDDSVIRAPLTAVKFSSTKGSVFQVVDEVLVSVPVELGSVTGSVIEIVSGIDNNTEFVVDARGLNEGEKVVVVK